MGFFDKIFGRSSAKTAASPAPARGAADDHYTDQSMVDGVGLHSHLDEPLPDFYTDLSSQQVAAGLEQGRFQIVDVRFKHEWDSHHIEQAVLIPLPELDGRLGEINSERETVFVCEHGMRSLNACYIAWQSGMEKRRIFNLVGGMAGYRGPKVTGR